MDFDDFVVFVSLYVGLARRRQKMSSPDKEKMDKKTQEFLDFVFDKKRKKDDKDKDRAKANSDGKTDDKSK
ncbi:MAG: hypothetical protein IKR42_06615 [Campylobacter sp.]|nr:hypothetical protein [Campylobacter sp.]